MFGPIPTDGELVLSMPPWAGLCHEGHREGVLTGPVRSSGEELDDDFGVECGAHRREGEVCPSSAARPPLGAPPTVSSSPARISRGRSGVKAFIA